MVRSFLIARPARRLAAPAALLIAAVVGCGDRGGLFGGSPSAGGTSAEIRSGDTAFTPTTPAGAKADDPSIRIVARTLTVAVLHVQVPARHAEAAANVWTHFDEGDLGDELAERLRRNGLRVGVAHVGEFEAMRTILDSIAGVKVTQTAPLNVPAGYPLLLEMDADARDQTLFCVAGDGILSGGTYTGSRNAIRIAYETVPQDPRRIRFRAVPEVHQRLDGYRWIRTEAGLWQAPNDRVFVFDAAAIALELERGELILLAPGDAAAVGGLIGPAMLTREIEGERYHSYVFLRPDVNDVGQRD